MTEHGHHEELASGSWGRVLGVRLPNGYCPSYDWLAALDARAQGAMEARLNRLASVGWLKTPENFRQLSDDGSPVVFEVKHVGQNLRLYVIKGHQTYFATHGGLKPKKSRVQTEIERARRIYQEIS